MIYYRGRHINWDLRLWPWHWVRFGPWNGLRQDCAIRTLTVGRLSIGWRRL